MGQAIEERLAKALQENEELRRALDTRTVIGQAQGILMERHKVDADTAFQLLIDASQHLNWKLHDIAKHLADTGELPAHHPSSN